MSIATPAVVSRYHSTLSTTTGPCTTTSDQPFWKPISGWVDGSGSPLSQRNGGAPGVSLIGTRGTRGVTNESTARDASTVGSIAGSHGYQTDAVPAAWLMAALGEAD